MKIYGKNVVKEALLSGDVKEVYLANNFRDDEIMFFINKHGINKKILPKEKIDRMVDGMHQGIIAEVPDFEYNTLDEVMVENGFLVILDHLEDPHNFGAIIRTCEAAGVNGIIIPKDRSVSVNPTVIKVSTGAIKNMKIAQVTNINNAIDELKKNGYWIVGTDMEGENYDEIDYGGSIAIVIGNEGSGMSKLTHDKCDFIASIPMRGKTNSLNASVATGIIIFNALKNRGKNGL